MLMRTTMLGGMLAAALSSACGSSSTSGSRPPNAVGLTAKDLTVESVSSDGKRLVVTTLDTPCALVSLAGVVETSAAVTLRLRVTTPPTPTPASTPTVCPAVAHVERLRVSLAEPIQGRALTSTRVAGG
jgi:hypothetical protein